MAVEVENILHGSCTVTVDGATDVGYTQGGVQLRKDRTMLDVEADQAAGIVKKGVVMERFYIVFTMLEASVANLLMAMAEPPANTAGSGDLEFGSASPPATEHTLTIAGPGPADVTRTYIFYRCVVSEGLETNLGSRTEVSLLPVTFELLKDSNQDDAVGYYEDSA